MFENGTIGARNFHKLNRAQLRLLKEEVLKRKWTKIGLKVDEMSPSWWRETWGMRWWTFKTGEKTNKEE